MWIFTNRGFFSVVEDADDPTMFQVRARAKGDLENLKDMIPGLKIVELGAHRDYPYRIFVERGAWAQVMTELTDDIDYTNFKDSVTAKQGNARHDVYMQIWSVARKLQHWHSAPKRRDDLRFFAPEDDPRGPHDPECILDVFHTGPCAHTLKAGRKRGKRTKR